jgi:hypothetical protein
MVVLSKGKRAVVVPIMFHSSFLGCSSRQDGESAIAMDLMVVKSKGATATAAVWHTLLKRLVEIKVEWKL